MATGPDGEDQVLPTFADVMNGFSFDSGRRSKSRRWGRGRKQEPPEQLWPSEQPWPPEQPWPAVSGLDEQPSADVADDDQRAVENDDQYAQVDSNSTFVRPYTWTRGRTRSGYALEIETLVSTSLRGRAQMGLLQVEHRAVAEICQQARSVAEVAALLRVPLGVAKVLVGDMAGLGLVAVHQSVSANGDVPDLSLMERVLSGLRRL